MQPRHLQHMSMEAFYELYLLWGSGNGDTRMIWPRAVASPMSMKSGGGVCSNSGKPVSTQGVMVWLISMFPMHSFNIWVESLIKLWLNCAGSTCTKLGALSAVSSQGESGKPRFRTNEISLNMPKANTFEMLDTIGVLSRGSTPWVKFQLLQGRVGAALAFSSLTSMGWISRRPDILVEFHQPEIPIWCLETTNPCLGMHSLGSILKLTLENTFLVSLVKMFTSWKLNPLQNSMASSLTSEVVESYFVLEPDVPKDSSTEVTCILRALDQAREILDARGVAMPSHLCIEAHCLLKLKMIYMLTWPYIYICIYI